MEILVFCLTSRVPAMMGAGICALIFLGCTADSTMTDAGDGQDDAGEALGDADGGDGIGDRRADDGDWTDHDAGADDSDGISCPTPEPHQQYCVIRDDACDFDPHYCKCHHEGSICIDGEWACHHDNREHPPPMPEFEDWAWECGIYVCDAQQIPDSIGDDWQEPQPYAPPDVESLTGDWELRADSDSIVAPGCERQPRQYAEGDCLAIDPANPDVIYVGLVGNDPVYFPTGVFKSVDGGRSWFEARVDLGRLGCWWPCTRRLSIRHLFIDPHDPLVLFASTYERGLYRSLDGARSWEFVELPDPCPSPGPVGKGDNGLTYSSCAGLVYRSDDHGSAWERCASAGEIDRHTTAFGFDNRLPDRVWLGRGRDSDAIPGEGYLFLSDDAGETWIELGQDIDAECQGFGRVGSIDVCDADPNQMAVAVYRCGLFYSNDGGISWYRVAEPVDGSRISSARFAPLPDLCRLFASENSLLWTEDGGRSWTRELDEKLDQLFFNSYRPQIIAGIVEHEQIDDSLFEFWVRE